MLDFVLFLQAGSSVGRNYFSVIGEFGVNRSEGVDSSELGLSSDVWPYRGSTGHGNAPMLSSPSTLAISIVAARLQILARGCSIFGTCSLPQGALHAGGMALRLWPHTKESLGSL